MLLVDQMRAIDTVYVVGGPGDYLDAHELDELEHAVGRYLGLS